MIYQINLNNGNQIMGSISNYHDLTHEYNVSDPLHLQYVSTQDGSQLLVLRRWFHNYKVERVNVIIKRDHIAAMYEVDDVFAKYYMFSLKYNKDFVDTISHQSIEKSMAVMLHTYNNAQKSTSVSSSTIH
jgi:hypothetical protein